MKKYFLYSIIIISLICNNTFFLKPMESNDIDYFAKLPDEVIRLILLKSIESSTDFYQYKNIRSTCKKINSISKNISHNALSLNNYQKNIFNYFPDKTLIKIFSHTTDIADLMKLREVSFRFNYLITQLTPISISFSEFNKCYKLNSKQLIQIFSHFKNIVYLCYNNRNNNLNFDKEFIAKLNQICPNLKEFRFYHCYQLTDLIFNNFPKLTILNLFWEFSLTNLQITNCPNLEEINIYWEEKLINLTINNCPKLKKIQTHCLFKLKNLTINNCPELNELQIINAEKLVNCKINNCPNLNLIDSCNTLNHKNFKFTPKINTNNMKYMAFFRPKMQCTIQ